MKLLDFVYAARPMLLLPVWTVYLVSLHYHHQLSGESFSLLDLQMLGSLSLVFAGAFYVNQVYDYETDLINKKGGFLQRAIVSHRAMMIAYLVVTIVGIVLAALLSGVAVGLVLLVFLLGYTYSAPPFRLKDRPIGSVFANAFAHGFLVPLAVMPDMDLHTVGQLGWDNPFYFLLTVGSVSIVTMIPDVRGDRETGKRTLAVAVGLTISLLLAAVMAAGAAYTAFGDGRLILAGMAALAAAMQVTALVLRSERWLLACAKVPLLLLTLLAGWFFPGYLVFVVALLFATRIYYRKRFDVLYPRLA